MTYDHLAELIVDENLNRAGYLDHLEDLTGPINESARSIELLLEELQGENLKGLDPKTRNRIYRKTFALEVLTRYLRDSLGQLVNVILERTHSGLED